MNSKEKIQNRLFSIDLSSEVKTPTLFEKNGKDYVLWGEKGCYPKALISLKNGSPLHGSILKSKAFDVAGKKITIKEGKNNYKLQSFLDNVNRNGESLFDVVKKVASDFELYGGFALQVIYSKDQSSIELFHLPFDTIGCGKKDEFGNINSFYISEDWSKQRPTYKVLPSYNKNTKGGSQVFYFVPYDQGSNYFPIPDYVGGINSIESEIKINELYNSLVSNGFFPSLLLNFNNGIPTQEEAGQIYDSIVEQFSGSKNAGKLLLNFSNSKDESPDVTVLPVTDADKLFNEISDKIQTKIVQAHRIVSPMLVGIKTEGQLGGSSELQTASELYHNKVIKPKQQVIIDELNYILSNLGYTDTIEIIPNETVSFSFSENILMQIMTKDEMRNKIGLKPIEETTNPTIE